MESTGAHTSTSTQSSAAEPSAVRAPSFWQRVFHHPSTAWMILFCSFFITAIAWSISTNYIDRLANERFGFLADDTVAALVKRMFEQEMVLRGGLALFAASESVERREWRAYAETLEIEKNFPGLLGFGYSKIVMPHERDAHVRAVRAEGFPTYDIRPAGRRDVYSSVVFLEPFDQRNQRAFGYDMLSEPVRRAAMAHARDTGRATISGKVKLVQEVETDIQNGLIMYLPLYRRGRPAITLEQRQAALVGFIYSPFRVNDLMRGIIGTGPQDIHFEIYDGDRVSPAAALYSSRTSQPAAENHPPDAGYQMEKRVSLHGRTWTLVFHSGPGLLTAAEESQPLLVAIGGILIDVLLFLTIASISRRQRAAEALASAMTSELQMSAERTRAIVENVIDGIVTADENGCIESFNASAERIFGFQAAEVVGQRLGILMAEPARSKFEDHIFNRSGVDVLGPLAFDREMEGRRKNGSTFPMDFAINETQVSGRRVFMGIVRDITERKKMDRMKEEFISTVSHELRTPLTSIRGSLGLLKGAELGRFGERAKSLINVAHKNVERLSRLVNDILDMEKMATGKMSLDFRTVDPVPLVQAAIEENQTYAEQYGVSLTFTASPTVGRIRVDVERLHQVIANLLSNAIKFSPAGSTVAISVEVHEGRARISVRDQGPGIPLSFRSRLFMKFAQAENTDVRAKGGSGLGLAIARDIVDRMSGRISFDSEEGRGSTFRVEFPLVLGATATPRGLDGDPLLVIDDNAAAASYIQLILTGAGFGVDVSGSGEWAVERLNRRPYRAIALDIGFLEHTGLALIRTLRAQARTKHLPILLLFTSESANSETVTVLGMARIADWVSHPADLAKAIGVAVSRRPAGYRNAVLVGIKSDLADSVEDNVQGLANVIRCTDLPMARAQLAKTSRSIVVVGLESLGANGWQFIADSGRYRAPPDLIVLSRDDVTVPDVQEIQGIPGRPPVSAADVVEFVSDVMRAAPEAATRSAAAVTANQK